MSNSFNHNRTSEPRRRPLRAVRHLGNAPHRDPEVCRWVGNDWSFACLVHRCATPPRRLVCDPLVIFICITILLLSHRPANLSSAMTFLSHHLQGWLYPQRSSQSQKTIGLRSSTPTRAQALSRQFELNCYSCQRPCSSS